MSLMRILSLVIMGFLSLPAFGQHHVLDRTMHYVRNTAAREWSEFPAEVNERSLVITFSSKKNAAEQTLSLRQYDVKQTWKVLINGKDIGTLLLDEKDMITYFLISPGILLDGKNTLEI